MSDQQHPVQHIPRERAAGESKDVTATQASAGGAGAGPAGAAEAVRAVGAQLGQLRESKGWSVQDVSARLKVPPAKLLQLEAGDLSRMPGITFAIGVVRSYAKMLGIDPAPLSDVLHRSGGPVQKDLSLPAPSGADMPRSRAEVNWGSAPKRRPWLWPLALAVVALAVLAFWRVGGESSTWLARLKASAPGASHGVSGGAPGVATMNGTASDSGAVSGTGAADESGAASAGSLASDSGAASATPAPGAAGTAGGGAADSAGASANTLATLPAPTAGQLGSNTAASASSAAATAAALGSAPLTPAVTPATPAAASLAAAGGQPGRPASDGVSPASQASVTASQASVTGGQASVMGSQASVTVKVTQDSWFSVRQKDGKEVFSGVVREGDEKNVQGAAPFKVTIGNKAGLASLTFDGKAVNPSKYAAAKGNVARFTLP